MCGRGEDTGPTTAPKNGDRQVDTESRLPRADTQWAEASRGASAGVGNLSGIEDLLEAQVDKCES